MKQFNSLLEDISICPPSDGVITDSEARDLVSKFKRVFDVIGVDFAFSSHAGLKDRLTHARNKPPISSCEFDHVMSMFIKKMGKQLYNDSADIQSRKVQARGKNADNIRPNNFEYGIVSRSTGIAIILAVQPNPRGKNAARINIVTVMRKRGFKVNQGETVMVEGVSYEPEWIVID